MGLLPVEQAFAMLWEHTPGPDREELSWHQALGRVLLEPAFSLLDDPAFDRSSMDGFSLQAAGTHEGSRLPVTATILAGQCPSRPLESGGAVKVMTGAPIPAGSDAVVPVEDCRESDGFVELLRPVRPGENLRYRGENLRAGEAVFSPGRRLDALDVATGIALGIERAAVAGRPSATVLATGSELVEPGSPPGPGQIPNSNGPMLAALWQAWGGRLDGEASVPDGEQELEAAIQKGLESDHLVLSGGVSVGERDLVPELLERAGVQRIFHKVAMKPGKPIYFGRRGDTVVLGLPGNPVSSFVGALLFLQASLRKRMALPPLAWRTRRLVERHESGGGRTRFEPALLVDEGGVKLLPHKGSADLPAWRGAEALVELPSGRAAFEAGSPLRVLLFRHAGREAGA